MDGDWIHNGKICAELDGVPIFEKGEDTDKVEPTTSDQGDSLPRNQEGVKPRKRRTLDPEEHYIFRGKIREYLVNAQRRYPSPRYRKDLDDGKCNEEDLVNTLKDLMDAHADVRYENHFMRNTPSGRKFESNKIIKDLELQVDKLTRKLQRDKDDADNKISDLRHDNQREAAKLKDDIKAWKTKSSNSDHKVNVAVSNAKLKLNLEHNRILSERDSEISSLKLQIAQLEGEGERTSIRHKTEMARMKEEVIHNERQLAKNHFKPKIAVLETENNDLKLNLTGIEERLNAEFKLKEAHYTSELDKWVVFHDEEMRKLEDELKEDLDAAKKATEKLKLDHAEELNSINGRMEALKLTHTAQIKELTSKHEEKLKEKDRNTQLALAKERKSRDIAVKAKERENQSLKRGLVNRDNELDKFKPLTDRDLSDRFQELAREVDDAARVKWDTSEKTWPVPERQIKKSENERRTRQRIMQNTIWVILNDKIFETPFRVLGPAGKPMESMWVKEFSLGESFPYTDTQFRLTQGNIGATVTDDLYTWPKATTETERWRRNHVRGLMEIIDQQILSVHPNYDLKQGYESTIQEAHLAMVREMGRVSTDKSVNETLEQIALKAARLWVESGVQWYRTQLRMSESGKKPVKSGNKGRGLPQELVVMPELRRIGNSEANGYDKDEIVKGCEGEFGTL
jgi:hypothetical protein